LEQESPFPVHINAYFSLRHENRTHLFDYDERGKTVKAEQSEWCTDWNLYIMNFIVYPLYIQVMEYLKE
jgi:hypothetical protein